MQKNFVFVTFGNEPNLLPQASALAAEEPYGKDPDPAGGQQKDPTSESVVGALRQLQYM